MRTRTADLYRVKAASLCTSKDLEGVGNRCSTCKYGQDGIVTGEITGEEVRTRCRSRLARETILLDQTRFLENWERSELSSYLAEALAFTPRVRTA